MASARTTSRAAKDDDFTAFMQARQGVLLRRAHLLTGEHAAAEDLVQATLAKMYLAWDTIRDHGALDAYARRIMVNEHNSWWRRAWRRSERSTDRVPEQPVFDTHDEGLSSALWAAVQTLGPRQRAVIVLRYYEGLSEIEIADTLGVSPGTVKSQASRALATLRANAAAGLDPHQEES